MWYNSLFSLCDEIHTKTLSKELHLAQTKEFRSQTRNMMVSISYQLLVAYFVKQPIDMRPRDMRRQQYLTMNNLSTGV